jgi:hypothetical protein
LVSFRQGKGHGNTVDYLFAFSSRCKEQWGTPMMICRIQIRAMGYQQADELTSDVDRSLMQWSMGEAVPRVGVRPVFKQELSCVFVAVSRREMKRSRPSIISDVDFVGVRREQSPYLDGITQLSSSMERIVGNTGGREHETNHQPHDRYRNQ